MSSARDFIISARLASVTAAVMFALIVVGSIVRTTGSGLACPDWPLCHGRLIPPLQFNILIEWFHRLLALAVGLLLLATAAWTLLRPETRASLGGQVAVAIALYLSQALLGALTVWKLLDPNVVSGHLAVGLVLFATLLSLGLVAGRESRRARPGQVPPRAATRPPGLLPLFGLATAAIWMQAVLGGMVSTNHASLACPDWPTCKGEWFPALDGLVGLQMAHRYGAYVLVALLGIVSWRAGAAPDLAVRNIGRSLFLLVLAQAGLGAANVLLGVPVWLSAVHLGNAALLLALAVIGTHRLAAMPAAERVPAAEHPPGHPADPGLAR